MFAQYRLELENIKPSFEVKIKTGLHRGPYKSKRTRRSHIGSSAEEFDDFGRPITYAVNDDGDQPFQRTKLPAVRYDDDDVDALSAKVRAPHAVTFTPRQNATRPATASAPALGFG